MDAWALVLAVVWLPTMVAVVGGQPGPVRLRGDDGAVFLGLFLVGLGWVLDIRSWVNMITFLQVVIIAAVTVRLILPRTWRSHHHSIAAVLLRVYVELLTSAVVVVLLEISSGVSPLVRSSLLWVASGLIVVRVLLGLASLRKMWRVEEQIEKLKEESRQKDEEARRRREVEEEEKAKHRSASEERRRAEKLRRNELEEKRRLLEERERVESIRLQREAEEAERRSQEEQLLEKRRVEKERKESLLMTAEAEQANLSHRDMAECDRLFLIELYRRVGRAVGTSVALSSFVAEDRLPEALLSARRLQQWNLVAVQEYQSALGDEILTLTQAGWEFAYLGRLPGTENPMVLVENIERMIMGDFFSNIKDSTIINRSSLKNAMNRAVGQGNSGLAGALEEVGAHVAESGSTEAGENFDGLTEELQREAPRRALMSSLWAGLLAALPSVAELGDATARIVEALPE